MYNNSFKYYTKKIFGPRNEMWHFDHWVREYYCKSAPFLNEFNWETNELPTNENKFGLKKNPIYDISIGLREKALNTYINILRNKNLTVLLHIPPLEFSPGANSWMINFQIALQHMGVKVNSFWEELSLDALAGVDYIFGIGAPYITKKIDWKIIESAKSKSNILVLLQTTFNVESSIDAVKFINSYRELGVDYFFSFDSENFNQESGLSALFEKQGTFLFSIEFSANPIIHFPREYINPRFDYVFIASTNYDKICRYNQYFPAIIHQFKGLITGPGWPWCKSYSFSSIRDQYIYAQSKIAINLHLQTQIDLKRQINERAYIIAALGVPQLTDNAAAIPDSFPKIGMVADTPVKYVESMKYLLNNEIYRVDLATNALESIYSNNTTFHRCMELFTNLNSMKDAE